MNLDAAYRIIGVERDASEAEIRRAYRARAKALHPDRQGGEGAASSDASQGTSDPAANEAGDEAANVAGDEAGNEAANEAGNEAANEAGDEAANEAGDEAGNEAGNEAANEAANEAMRSLNEAYRVALRYGASRGASEGRDREGETDGATPVVRRVQDHRFVLDRLRFRSGLALVLVVLAVIFVVTAYAGSVQR